MKTQRFQCRRRLPPGRWSCRQPLAVLRTRVAGQIPGREPGQPVFQVRRKAGEGRLVGREQLVAAKDHVVLAGAQRDAAIRQAAAHLVVARHGGRLLVVVGKHGLYAQAVGQLGQQHLGAAPQEDQTGVFGIGHMVDLCQPAQLTVQLVQTVVDELDAPVGARQRIQHVAVPGEDAIDLAAAAQRQPQRRVVVAAQIAAEPHQAGVEFGLGGDRGHALQKGVAGA